MYVKELYKNSLILLYTFLNNIDYLIILYYLIILWIYNELYLSTSIPTYKWTNKSKLQIYLIETCIKYLYVCKTNIKVDNLKRELHCSYASLMNVMYRTWNLTSLEVICHFSSLHFFTLLLLTHYGIHETKLQFLLQMSLNIYNLIIPKLYYMT